MKITAGHLRGRTLRVPEIEGLRPTPSRVREALFNILGDIQDCSVLDLFSGSGIISLEALSRGASHAQSIEEDNDACKAMNLIQTSWDVENWHITRGTLPRVLPEQAHFDVIYADPPYAKGLAEQVPKWLNQKGITYNTLVIEEASRTNIKWAEQSMPNQVRKYSETTLYFFQWDIEIDA